MELQTLTEVNQTKLDRYLLAHLIQRNVAIGANYDWQITDLIWGYELFQNFINLQDWYAEARVNLLTILLKSKSLALKEIINKGRQAENIDEKRMYLIDAIRLEKEIEGLLSGR